MLQFLGDTCSSKDLFLMYSEELKNNTFLFDIFYIFQKIQKTKTRIIFFSKHFLKITIFVILVVPIKGTH